MSQNRVFILTGATSGLGLFLATKLMSQAGNELIVGARSPSNAGSLKRLEGKAKLSVFRLDLSEMASVGNFTNQVIEHIGPNRRISAVFCNAGLQITGPKRMTVDGLEETFATNHLGHFLLVENLLVHIKAGGTVISTASGTHNPDDKLAARFGFRGAIFKNAAAVSIGDVGDGVSILQQGMDRYATSKLCNILFTKAMAQRIPASEVRFIAFDPGLMPGTELARERPAPLRFAWKRVLPLMQRFIPGVSSPQRSAEALFRLAFSTNQIHSSGSYVEFTGKPASRSAAAEDMQLAHDLLEVSKRLTT